MILGGVYADSEGYATTTLGSGVSISATGTFNLESSVTNTMAATINIEGGLVDPNLVYAISTTKTANYGLKIPGPTIDFAYGVAVSNAATTVEQGATVQAGGLTAISSNVENDFQTAASSSLTAPGLQNPGTKKGNAEFQGEGVAVAISNITSSSSTQVNGNVTAGASAGITSEADNNDNDTYSFAKVRNEPISEKLNVTRGEIFENEIPNLVTGGLRQSTGPLGLAAGVTVVQSSNQASAYIGPTGAVMVHGNLTVNATASDNFHASAIGAGLSQSTVALGGAFDYANESNQAFASIESTAGVNATGALSVTADATIPVAHNLLEQFGAIAQFFTDAVDSSQTPLLTTGDIQDVTGLTNELVNQLDPLASYLWGQIPAADQATLASSSSAPLLLAETLVNDLNAIISGGISIYTAARFAGVTLSSATQKLLDSNPTGEQIELLNRMLLDDAYPSFISGVLQSNEPSVPADLSDPNDLAEVQALLEQFELAASYLGDASAYLNGEAGLPQNVTTTYVGAASESGSQTGTLKTGTETQTEGLVGVSGSLNIFTTDNVAKAWVGQGARINQDPSFASPDQCVKVEANASTSAVDAGGFTAVPTVVLGTGHGTFGSVGGTAVVLNFTNTAQAYVADGAAINCVGDFNVASTTNVLVVNLTVQGGTAHSWAFNGGLAYTDLANQTLAYVAATATIKAGGNVSVGASYTLLGVMVTGANSGIPFKGSSVAVGVSVAYNQMSNDTQAYIGEPAPPSPGFAPGSVTAGGNVTVQATTSEMVYTVSVAGAYSSNDTLAPPAPGGGGAGAGEGAATPAPAEVVESAPAKTVNKVMSTGGVAISGAVTINELPADSTLAYVSGGGTVTTSGTLTINAASTLDLLAVSGSLAISNSIVGVKERAPGNGGTALAGAFTLNNLEEDADGDQREAQAYTQDVTLHAVDTTVEASNTARIFSFAAGAAGTIAKKATAGVAGSVNIDLLSFDTSGRIGRAHDPPRHPHDHSPERHGLFRQQHPPDLGRGRHRDLGKGRLRRGHRRRRCEQHRAFHHRAQCARRADGQRAGDGHRNRVRRLHGDQPGRRLPEPGHRGLGHQSNLVARDRGVYRFRFHGRDTGQRAGCRHRQPDRDRGGRRNRCRR